MRVLLIVIVLLLTACEPYVLNTALKIEERAKTRHRDNVRAELLCYYSLPMDAPVSELRKCARLNR